MAKQRRNNKSGSEPKEKNGVFESRVQCGHKTNGKPYYIYGYGKTKAQCTKNLREKLAKYELGIENDTVYENESLFVQIKTFLKLYKEPNLEKSSYSRLIQTLNKDIDSTIGYMKPQDIGTDDVQKALIKLKEEGRSYSTLKKFYLLLNEFYKHENIAGKLNFNPVMAARLPAKYILRDSHANEIENFDSEIKYYKQDEVEKIINEAKMLYKNGKPKHRLGWAYILVLQTGIRRGEALGLKWSSVSEDYIQIKQTLVEVDGKVIIKKPKTKNSERKIKLTSLAKEAIRNLTEISNKSEYVISTATGNYVRTGQFYRGFDSICKNAGVPNYGIHSLRHTFASMLFNKGCDLPLISQLLGHADTLITQKIYVHILQELKDKTIESLNDIDIDKYCF